MYVITKLLYPVHFSHPWRTRVSDCGQIPSTLFVFTVEEGGWDVGHCGGRERWGASCDDDVNVVLSAVAVAKMVKDVGYCVQKTHGCV